MKNTEKYFSLHSLFILAGTFLIASLFFSCKKQNSSGGSTDLENELLTTVKLNFIDTTAQDTNSFIWRQPKGPGSAITCDTILLEAGKFYRGYTEVWDESKTPAIDYTPEIRDLANEHQFFYLSNLSALNISLTDSDTHTPALPLGLNFNWSHLSSTPWNGTLQVQLRHYTDLSPKTGGVANGNTDIAVSFPVQLK